jgi:hypothetical protein
MPSPCSRFSHLVRRFELLKGKFIADQVAQEQRDFVSFVPDLERLAAFRLLFHAEVETFLEAKARDGISAVDSALNSSDRQLDLSTFFGLVSVLQLAVPSSSAANSTDFVDFVGRTLKQGALDKISKNNGIKQGSFVFLSLCAGKRLEQIDQALVATLNSYGEKRGQVAHNSVSKVSTIQAPSAELKSATEIIEALDRYFNDGPVALANSPAA